MSDSIDEQRCDHGWNRAHNELVGPGQLNVERCPGPSVVTPPAQDDPLCYWTGHDCLCGASAVMSYEQRRETCHGRRVPVPAAPSVSTDHTDERPGQQQAINVALTAFYASPANEHTRHAVGAAVEAAYPVIARAVLQDFLDNYTKGLAGRG